MSDKIDVELTKDDLDFLKKIADAEKLVKFTKGVLRFYPIASILSTGHVAGKIFTFQTTDWIEHFADGPSNLERVAVCGISKQIQEYVVLNDIEGERYDFFVALDKQYSEACTS